MSYGSPGVASLSVSPSREKPLTSTATPIRARFCLRIRPSASVNGKVERVQDGLPAAEVRSAELAEQLLEVKRLVLLRTWAWPGFGRSIPGQLEPVLIRISQVDGIGCSGAIRCRIDLNPSVDKAFQCRARSR